MLAEDLTAIEIALLAAFQQDLNIEASCPQVRIPNLKQASVYHLPGDKPVPERFPYRMGDETVVKPDPLMYPSRPLNRIDDYSRPIVFYRLCRFFQDNFPNLPFSGKLAYCILIERMATVGTKLINSTLDECLTGLAKEFPPCLLQDNPSLVSLVTEETHLNEVRPSDTLLGSPQSLPLDNIDFEWLSVLFKHEAIDRTFSSSEPLYLLWADALAALEFTFPNVTKVTRRQLLQRSKLDIIPLVVLALSS